MKPRKQERSDVIAFCVLSFAVGLGVGLFSPNDKGGGTDAV